MMATGDKPRQDTGDGQGVTSENASAGGEIGANRVPTSETLEWNSDEPFIDQEEIADPIVHEWRMKMSRVHSSGWGKWPKSNMTDVKSVGEILNEHPLLSKLIDNGNTTE
jgi:hypothetical protein